MNATPPSLWDRFEPFLLLFRTGSWAFRIPALVLALAATAALGSAEWSLTTPIPEMAELDKPRSPWGTDAFVLEPLVNVWNHAGHALAPGVSWRLRGSSCLLFMLHLIVATLAGGAIVRATSLSLADDRGVDLKGLVLEVASTVPTALIGLLIPLGAGALLLAAVAVTNLPSLVFGDNWTVAVAVLVYPLTVAAALLIVLVSVIWPLAIAAVVTDGSDGFGAWSRAYSYVSARPWTFVGILLLALVSAQGVHLLCTYVLGLAANLMRVGQQGFFGTTWPSGTVVGVEQQWLAMSLRYSLTWTSVAAVYHLLRLIVDGTPVNFVAPLKASDTRANPYPVVGFAAGPASQLPPDTVPVAPTPKASNEVLPETGETPSIV